MKYITPLLLMFAGAVFALYLFGIIWQATTFETGVFAYAIGYPIGVWLFYITGRKVGFLADSQRHVPLRILLPIFYTYIFLNTYMFAIAGGWGEVGFCYMIKYSILAFKNLIFGDFKIKMSHIYQMLTFMSMFAYAIGFFRGAKIKLK